MDSCVGTRMLRLEGNRDFSLPESIPQSASATIAVPLDSVIAKVGVARLNAGYLPSSCLLLFILDRNATPTRSTR